MLVRTRIINVERKPRKCLVCGQSMWDIIYGTGDISEVEFLLEYQRDGIMGGDNIPRRPPHLGIIIPPRLSGLFVG